MKRFKWGPKAEICHPIIEGEKGVALFDDLWYVFNQMELTAYSKMAAIMKMAQPRNQMS